MRATGPCYRPLRPLLRPRDRTPRSRRNRRRQSPLKARAGTPPSGNPPSGSPPSGTQAIQRALRLLQDISESGTRGLTLTELSGRHQLARPTVHRLLAALQYDAMIERQDATGRYTALWRPPSTAAAGASQPRFSPFHERLTAACQSHQWRDWAGTIAPSSFEPTTELEVAAVRHTAALFDVSPLYKVEFRGPDAEAATNRLFTRDTRKCREHQVQYTCWCDDEGKLLQDGNLVRLGGDHFRITTADPSLAWFEDACRGFDVEVVDVSDDVAALALQGPRSCAVLQRALPGAEIESLRFFRAREAQLQAATGAVEVLLTRTGFTGDLGYEIWLPAERALDVWDALMKAGAGHGLRPAGLETLDRCRIEAGLVLIEVDFVNASHALLDVRQSTPDETGLGWTVKLNPGNDFIGRRAIEEERERAAEWRLVGVEIAWSELERVYRPKGLRPTVVGEAPDRTPRPLYRDGKQVGQVTSQVFSALLKRHIGLASVHADAAEPGTELEIDLLVDTEFRRATARIVPLPFFDPPQKRATPVETPA
ncbi:MAG: glycine cleavage T C-terminal barrel domain-containing protein [Acidobacteriota bacterium]